MRKTKKALQKSKKKGFTLVELLAVIIILAIVVGITIPAVLTTTNNTKKKALQTAADAMADWVDRQYQVYSTGIDVGGGLATLDGTFKSQCIDFVKNGKNYKCSSTKKTGADAIQKAWAMSVTADFIQAAGLKPTNIKTADTLDFLYVQSLTLPSTIWIYEKTTRVYINENTGRSCVTLVAADNGDYPKGAVACGGICQSDTEAQDYCKPKP